MILTSASARKILLTSLAIFASFGLYLFAIRYLSDGFSLRSISAQLPFFASREKCIEEVQNCLSQSFYYLGKGSQCFVFESEDKQLVLKFFRHSRYRAPPVSDCKLVPSFIKNIQAHKRDTKQKQLASLFQSCKLAYEELRDESNLLYVHLNRTQHLQKMVTLYDKLKRPCSIYIDDYTFIIQKHGEHIYPYLSKLIEQGKRREAQEALSHLLTLLRTPLQKGISSLDAVVQKNTGFQGNKAFFIDIGAFKKGNVQDIDRELRSLTKEVHSWLRIKDKELALYLEELLQTPPKSAKQKKSRK